MITFLTEDYNTFTQKNYNKCLEDIQFHQLSCSCGNKGNLRIHGYYKRSFKSSNGKCTLRICRVKCPHCRKTHALIPSFLVPYSQISLADQVAIIKASSTSNLQDVMHSNVLIDESNCYHIRRQFKRLWEQRLLSYHITMQTYSHLVVNCIRSFSRQFMQIKNTPNILFSKTT